jgi:hypothetical protein
VTEEFRVPEAARSCWLALEKGTSAPTEIDVRLRDVRLQPIARLSVLERYRLDPIPPSLEAVGGVHPRIDLNDRRIAQLRKAVATSHQALWKKVRAQADRAVRSGPPSYVKDDGHSGDEELWQREVGNTLPLVAMAYVVTGEKPYLEAARQWALASCNYKTWSLGADRRYGPGGRSSALRAGARLRLVQPRPGRRSPADHPPDADQAVIGHVPRRGDGLGLVEQVLPFSRHSPLATPSGFNGC